MLQFAPARKNDQIEFARFALRDITTARHAFATRLHIDLIQHRHSLPGEREQGRAVDPLRRGDKRSGRFFGISRANDIELRDHPQAAHRFDRLMRRAIFADADRVVREDVDVRQLESAARRIEARQ